jgi:hypothetical protein
MVSFSHPPVGLPVASPVAMLLAYQCQHEARLEASHTAFWLELVSPALPRLHRRHIQLVKLGPAGCRTADKLKVKLAQVLPCRNLASAISTTISTYVHEHICTNASFFACV